MLWQRGGRGVVHALLEAVLELLRTITGPSLGVYRAVRRLLQAHGAAWRRQRQREEVEALAGQAVRCSEGGRCEEEAQGDSQGWPSSLALMWQKLLQRIAAGLKAPTYKAKKGFYNSSPSSSSVSPVSDMTSIQSTVLGPASRGALWSMLHAMSRCLGNQDLRCI